MNTKVCLREAIMGIADDYIPVGSRNPGYVLIPITKFEQLCAAEKLLPPKPQCGAHPECGCVAEGSCGEAVSTPTGGGLSPADETQMALCQLDWIANAPTNVHPHRVKTIRLALERLATFATTSTHAHPQQGGERDGVHARAWVAAEYRVTSSPHEHTASDSLAMARYILSGKPPAGQSLKPCPEEAKEELCSFPACNCAKERLPAALTSPSKSESEPDLSYSGAPMPPDGIEGCVYCGVPFKEGDLVLSEYEGGLGHIGCFGPDRDSYVNRDGEPLKDDEPIPAGRPWTPTSSS